MRKFYLQIRLLHLYLGIFISPFLLIFGLGVLTFNHPDLVNRVYSVETLPTQRIKLADMSYEIPDLELAKNIMSKVNINGEISYVARNKNFISFPVNEPGLETIVKVNLNNDSVFFTQRTEGFLRSLSYLHSMPGPHNMNVRGNSTFMKIWRILADTVVYFVLFLTASGIILWYFIKKERKTGIYALFTGIVFFSGIILIIFW